MNQNQSTKDTHQESPEELLAAPKKRASSLQAILIPILAVFTGLLIGAIVVIVTDPDVLAAWGSFFNAPLNALSVSWNAIAVAYGSLFMAH